MFSFSRRKEQTQVEVALRRVLDRTTPNLVMFDGDNRCHNRHNRTLPALVTPRSGKNLLVERSFMGLTKDIGDSGLSVISPRMIEDVDVAVSLWLRSRQMTDSSAITLLGRAVHSYALGGGFWYIGIHLTERLADTLMIEQLGPRLEALLPPGALAEMA